MMPMGTLRVKMTTETAILQNSDIIKPYQRFIATFRLISY